MMDQQVSRRLFTTQVTLIFSIIFALVGFSYNVWRMEVSERNNNIRTASFEMLKELSALEQLIYTAHYDRDLKEGSPRKGWVKVGLIVDLSMLTSSEVSEQSSLLKQIWSDNWSSISTEKQSVDQIVVAIDSVRSEIQILLGSLQ